MKKGRMKYIVIIIVLIIYGVFMYLFFGIDESRERRASTTLLIGDSTVWNYSARDWMNVTNQQSLSSLDWQKFHVYVDNEYFGNYSVWLDDKWYLFDDNRNAVNYQGDLFAYQADFDMDVLPFTLSDIDDFSYVNQVLEEYELSSNASYTLANMTSFDFDKDGVLEDFYFVSNVFATDFFPDKYFSFVFMVKSGKIYMLYEDVDQNDGTNGCRPQLYTVADVDDDRSYELIVECSRYSVQEPVIMLYEFLDDEFKITISNQ